MATKTQTDWEKALKSFTKSNKEVRERKALKEGFSSIVDYAAYLKKKMNEPDVIVRKTPVKKTPSKAKALKTIHNVFIMDDSGSMSGSKYNNGVKGIQTLVESIQEDKLTKNTITIVDLNRGIMFWMKEPKDVKYEGTKYLGGTPLYRCMHKTIDALLMEDLKDTKVLLNITTDGGDTDGGLGNLPSKLKSIQEEYGFTVTFVGTAADVRFIQRSLNVDESNTLVHDNTGEGLENAFGITRSARMNYSANVAAGVDVSKSFYSKKKGKL